MNENLTITETLEQWKKGNLEIMNLWYDWFCKEKIL